MDWTTANAYKIKRFMLDEWEKENDAIMDGTGRYEGVNVEERLGALRGVRSIMTRVMASIDGKEAEE